MTRVHFPGDGGAELAGVLERPDGPPRAGIVLAHCFSCSKDHKTTTRLAKGLRSAGYAVLRFDVTGLGDSEGDFGTSTMASGTHDVASAAMALADLVAGPLALVGHSLGGSASLLAAPHLERVEAVVTVNAPASPAHLRLHLPDVEHRTRDDDTARITLAGRTFTVRRGFLDDLEEHDQLGAVSQLGRPLLVVHGLDDRLVGVGEGERIFAAASHPKAFVTLEGADHLLGDRRAVARVAAVIAGWLDATL
jgi:uncharacterized protein